MSWFTDLAGKAEDFLVKIDQNAAVAAQVLSTENKKHHSNKEKSHDAKHMEPLDINNQETNEESPHSKLTVLPPSEVLKPAKSSKVDRDAELMALLNVQGKSDGSSRSFEDSEKTNGISLQQENNLLKQEIRSLNHEVRQALMSANQADKDCKAAQQQLKAQLVTSKTSENIISSLRKENMSLADQLLDKEAELSKVTSQVEALIVNQEYHNQLGNLQQQLDTEISKRKVLESEMKLVLSSNEKEKTTAQAEVQFYQDQLQQIKNELSLSYQSHNEYKLRAQRILQDKDRLLQDIKERQTVEGVQPGELLVAELNQLQQERDLLREENSQSNSQLMQCRKEIIKIETRKEEELQNIQKAVSSLEEQLVGERSRRDLAENESRLLAEELRYTREDLSQHKVQSATKVHQLEAEMLKLRQQIITSKQNGPVAEVDFEQRLRALTNTLVAKQAALESLQSERSSLQLQLERALHQTSLNSPYYIDSEGTTRIHLNNITDDAKVTTSSVPHRVRNVYSTLDSLNFRLGQALRRRPAARLMLVIYMMMLHFWVVFVLFTYSPEVHGNEK